MRIKLGIIIFLNLIIMATGQLIFAKELVIYSARQEFLIKPILDKFTQQTGIETKLYSDNAGALFARLEAEGKNTPADLLITSDAGNLWNAQQKGFLRAVASDVLVKNVPKSLRSPDNMWFGVTIRARTIVYNPTLVGSDQISTYEDLANPKWRGKLCLRTSKNVYNQSMVAIMIKRLGYAKTKRIVKGWVDNLATKAFPSDTNVIEAIDAGQCTIGIVNSYYLARVLDKKPDARVNIFWANQADSGTHINISGAGVIAQSKNVDEALALLEFLVQEPAQKIFAELDFEYPINKDINPSKVVKDWGDFKSELINISATGSGQKKAIILMNEVGYK